MFNLLNSNNMHDFLNILPQISFIQIVLKSNFLISLFKIHFSKSVKDMTLFCLIFLKIIITNFNNNFHTNLIISFKR